MVEMEGKGKGEGKRKRCGEGRNRRKKKKMMKVEAKRKRYEEEEGRKASRKKMKRKRYYADIPVDVLVDILSRLPARCVWRLRSVCRDWKSQIESPSFADLHFRRGPKEEDEVFMFLSDGRYRDDTTRFYSIDKNNGKAVRAVEQELSHPARTTISSINGLVCYHATDWEIKVCNPVTRETIILPKPSFLSSSKSHLDFVIGFDSTSNTYKVLATSCLIPPQVEIFTLEGRTKGWRMLQLPSEDLQFYFKGGFYANGCAFWVTFEYNGDDSSDDDDEDRDTLLTLMTFNFAQEKFEMFPYPPDIEIGSSSIYEVGGRGCLIETKRKTSMVKLWTLAPDSSGKQVWVHHHTLLPPFEISLPDPVFPIPSGVMLFKRDEQRDEPIRYICFYNEQGQVVKSIRVHGIPSRFSPLQLHTETLVSLKTILAANL